MNDDDVVRLFRPAPWVELAACKGLPVALFHPDRGVPARTAKDVCWGDTLNDPCPVRLECLEYSLVEDIKHGVWGGFSEKQRRPMRKARWSPGKADVNRRRAETYQATCASRPPTPVRVSVRVRNADINDVETVLTTALLCMDVLGYRGGVV